MTPLDPLDPPPFLVGMSGVGAVARRGGVSVVYKRHVQKQSGVQRPRDVWRQPFDSATLQRQTARRVSPTGRLLLGSASLDWRPVCLEGGPVVISAICRCLPASDRESASST
jgi:hypothetical protein